MVWPGTRPVELPTTAFVTESYWLPTTHGGDATTLGLDAVGHPFLRAAASGTGTLVLTGRISLATHPWLADHAVQGQVVLPGAAMVDLVSRAGDEAGCGSTAQLTLLAPIVVPDDVDIRLRIDVAEPEPDGSRALTVHTRVGAGHWTPHATAILVPGDDEPRPPQSTWPPVDAEPLDVEQMYDRLEGAGLRYGPVFRGVRAMWRGSDRTMYAEVALPGAEPGEFGIHPALLDACLHPVALSGFLSGPPDRPSLPFEWSGVRVHAAGADTVRVTLSAVGADTVRVELVDPSNAPVASIEALVLSPLPEGALGLPDRGDLLRPQWAARSLPDGPIDGYAVRDPGLAELLQVRPTDAAARFVLVPAPPARPGRPPNARSPWYGSGSPRNATPRRRSSSSPVGCSTTPAKPRLPAWCGARSWSIPTASRCSISRTTTTPRSRPFPPRWPRASRSSGSPPAPGVNCGWSASPRPRPRSVSWARYS